MSEEKIFGGALKRENRDPRNYDLARFVPQKDRSEKEAFCLELPETIDIVINQYTFSACVGHAFASAVKLLTYQRTHKWVDIDPFVIYGTRNDMGRGGAYRGKGMYLDDAAYTVHHEGAFLRRDFGEQEDAPQIIDLVSDFKNTHPKLVEKAKDFCIEGYAWIDPRETDEIKLSLEKGMPVVCSYKTKGATGFSCDQYGYVKYPNKGEDRGLHCMVIIGWTKDDHWIVLNSWGTNFGKKGVLYIDFREPIQEAIAVSDKICPIKQKAKYLALRPDSFVMGYRDSNAVSDIKVELKEAPFIHKDRLYVPVRFVSEYLGAAVEWDAETGTATITSEEQVIKFTTNKKEIVIGGRTYKIDVTPLIKNDRMFLPVRYAAEYLNCIVNWDEKKNLAEIYAR